MLSLGRGAAPAFGGAGADKIAFHVRSPPSTPSIKRPVLVPVSAHGSAKDRNCALASTMRLTMPNRSKVLRASRSIRVTVTTSPGASLPSILLSSRRSPSRGRCCGCCIGGAKLLTLAVEGLPHGAYAGIADKAFFGVSFDHVLCHPISL